MAIKALRQFLHLLQPGPLLLHQGQKVAPVPGGPVGHPAGELLLVGPKSFLDRGQLRVPGGCAGDCRRD
ncbi:hypothetical protein ASG71_15545 [Arthrobacter sp. Soil763]|nr:hypothetical protein ASG71_15545 [Arthrobacter sp. Soil763]